MIEGQTGPCGASGKSPRGREPPEGRRTKHPRSGFKESARPVSNRGECLLTRHPPFGIEPKRPRSWDVETANIRSSSSFLFTGGNPIVFFGGEPLERDQEIGGPSAALLNNIVSTSCWFFCNIMVASFFKFELSFLFPRLGLLFYLFSFSREKERVFSRIFGH